MVAEARLLTNALPQNWMPDLKTLAKSRLHQILVRVLLPELPPSELSFNLFHIAQMTHLYLQVQHTVAFFISSRFTPLI
jgi:hypothetical protein